MRTKVLSGVLACLIVFGIAWWAIPAANFSTDTHDNYLYALWGTALVIGTLLAVPARSRAAGVGIVVGTVAAIVFFFVGLGIYYSQELAE